MNVEIVTRRDGNIAPQVNTVQTLTLNATGGDFRIGIQLDTDALTAVAQGLNKVSPAYVPTLPSSGNTVLTGVLAFDISAEELTRFLDPILNPNNTDRGLPHTHNFAVIKVGDVFVITFQGEHRALSIASSDIVNSLTLDQNGSTVAGQGDSRYSGGWHQLLRTRAARY